MVKRVDLNALRRKPPGKPARWGQRAPPFQPTKRLRFNFKCSNGARDRTSRQPLGSSRRPAARKTPLRRLLRQPFAQPVDQRRAALADFSEDPKCLPAGDPPDECWERRAMRQLSRCLRIQSSKARSNPMSCPRRSDSSHLCRKISSRSAKNS